MKIVEFLKQMGIKHILKLCNFDLRDCRELIIRECKLARGHDLSKIMKKFKSLQAEETNKLVQNTYITEYLNKVKE